MMELLFITIFLLQRQPPCAGARTGNSVDDFENEDPGDDGAATGDDERGQHWWVGAPWGGEGFPMWQYVNER